MALLSLVFIQNNTGPDLTRRLRRLSVNGKLVSSRLSSGRQLPVGDFRSHTNGFVRAWGMPGKKDQSEPEIRKYEKVLVATLAAVGLSDSCRRLSRSCLVAKGCPGDAGIKPETKSMAKRGDRLALRSHQVGRGEQEARGDEWGDLKMRRLTCFL